MRSLHVIAVLVAAASLGGCAVTDAHEAHGVMADDVLHAICVVTPTAGNTVRGIIRFDQTGDAVTITADVSGLSPNAQHAWHVHEWGDISSDDGTATGGHYNPEGHDHGLPGTEHRHAGDFGNLQADGSGRARATLVVTNVTIMGHRNPIAGRAIIIHAKRDDGGQPTGNAGARIAQGVIGVAKPK